jgi:hypothetical protein
MYLTKLSNSAHSTSNDWIIVNNEMEYGKNKVAVAYFMVLSRIFLEGLKEV